MHLLVTRHGETALNKQKKFYGSLNCPVDALGETQAAQLAEKLANVPIDVMLRSDMLRTAQTAAPIIATHPTTEVRIDARLNEMGFGKWEGLNADEIQAAYPQDWQTWLDHPFEAFPTGAESYPVFKTRVLAALDDYQDLIYSDLTVLLVAHLGTLRTWHQHWFPDTTYWDLHFEAGCYSTYEVTANSATLTGLNL